jgi:hypothetical protein
MQPVGFYHQHFSSSSRHDSPVRYAVLNCCLKEPLLALSANGRPPRVSPNGFRQLPFIFRLVPPTGVARRLVLPSVLEAVLSCLDRN